MYILIFIIIYALFHLIVSGFKAEEDAQITISNCRFQFSYFDGLFTFNSNNVDKNEMGNYTITDSVFSDIYGYQGSIVHISSMTNSTKILFKNSLFEYILSSDKGGIIYSLSNITDVNVAFVDCEFNGNYCFEGIKRYNDKK